MKTEAPSSVVTSFPPLFGVHRELSCPSPERYDFAAEDGTGLCLHHIKGGKRGPVIMTPGTAMTALTYCLDTVPVNMAEFLVAQGFDLWLFDWRTSPILAAHEEPYTLDDVARYDWPAAVREVRRRTGQDKVSVMAHCLSSPCFLLSLVRGYMPPEHIKAFVASQVALDLYMTPVGRFKLKLRVDKLLPGSEMIHQKASRLSGGFSDFAVSFLSLIIPKSYKCDNVACHRHSATFGDLIQHSNVSKQTHALMGDLVPECLTAFLKNVAIWGRRVSILTKEDRTHLDRLRIPIHLISGVENRMFVPKSTELTYKTLCDANGQENYKRTTYPGFGHLDCFIGDGAAAAIWPDIAETLGSGEQVMDEPPQAPVVTSVGITFREKMAGEFAMGVTEPSAAAGSPTTLTMHGTIQIDNLEKFIDVPDHLGSLSGSIDFAPLGENLIAKSGVFNLFIDTADPSMKYMVYEMAFESGGKNYYLAGHKDVKQAPVTDMWKATTTLYTQLHEGTDKSGPVIGAGVLSLGVVDLIEMVGTMRATDASSLEERVGALGRFGRFFLGELWETYVKHSKPE